VWITLSPQLFVLCNTVDIFCAPYGYGVPFAYGIYYHHRGTITCAGLKACGRMAQMVIVAFNFAAIDVTRAQLLL
jgi:hypothetical protein